MNTPVFALTLLSALLGAPTDRDCVDIYDVTETCEALDKTALENPGEPLHPGDRSHDPTVIDDSKTKLLPWGFSASSVVVFAAAAGLGGASFLLKNQVTSGAQTTPLSTEEITTLLKRRRGLQASAVTATVTASMLAGTALVFWVFDPARGRLRFDLPKDP